MKVKRECNTCEFNFNGVCAGHGDVYNYGEKIIDDTKGCDDWGADFKYFSEVMKEAPWYIKNDYENCKISFEEFLKKLDDSEYSIEYLNRCKEHDWGQRVIRIYDPDKHVIEIGESMEYVARRLLDSGMTAEQAAKKTQLPLPQIEEYMTGSDDKEEI